MLDDRVSLYEILYFDFTPTNTRQNVISVILNGLMTPSHLITNELALQFVI